jgi:hypothetical protein
MPDFRLVTKATICDWLDSLDPPIVYARTATKPILADVAHAEWERRFIRQIPMPDPPAATEGPPVTETASHETVDYGDGRADFDLHPLLHPDEKPDVRTVTERVHAVLAEMPPIGKDSRAPDSMGAYQFRGIEAITAELQPLLARHGLVMVPSVLDLRTEVRTTGNSKNQYVATVLLRVTFTGLDGDELIAEMWGQGADQGDKSISKAVTSAFKSLLGVQFCISDRETDTEAHHVEETGSEPSKDELARRIGFASEADAKSTVARVREAVEEAAKWEPEITQWVKDQGFPWPWPKAACDAIAEKCLGIMALVSKDPADIGEYEERAAGGPPDLASLPPGDRLCPSCGGDLLVAPLPGCQNGDHPF